MSETPTPAALVDSGMKVVDISVEDNPFNAVAQGI